MEQVKGAVEPEKDFNTFYSNVTFLFSLKTSEKTRGSLMFSGSTESEHWVEASTSDILDNRITRNGDFIYTIQVNGKLVFNSSFQFILFVCFIYFK